MECSSKSLFVHLFQSPERKSKVILSVRNIDRKVNLYNRICLNILVIWMLFYLNDIFY